MKRLLVFTENYGRGGGNQYLIDLVNGVAGDYESIAIRSNPGGVYQEDLDKLERDVSTGEVSIVTPPRIWIDLHEKNVLRAARLVRLMQAMDPLFFAYNVILCSREIRRVRPDAVLSCNGGFPAARSTLAMAVAAGRRHLPVILSIVSVPYERGNGLRGYYERWLDRRIWKHVSGVVLNAQVSADALIQRREAPVRRVHVIHNGLPDNPLKTPITEAAGHITVGCALRFDPEKGVGYLLDAFASVAADYPSVRLLVIGGGREHEAILLRARELGLADRVSLPGHVAGPIDDLIAGLDIYAFPSLYEGFPYSILEAMRAGVAIVSTDVGGIPEAIIDGETGLLVPAADAEALAVAIARLVDDDSLRNQLGAAARERFKREFSLDAMHERTRRVFWATGMMRPASDETD